MDTIALVFTIHILALYHINAHLAHPTALVVLLRLLLLRLHAKLPSKRHRFFEFAVRRARMIERAAHEEEAAAGETTVGERQETRVREKRGEGEGG